MEVIQRRDEEVLTDSEIATWHHIDPLAVARLRLVKRMLQKELDGALKAVRRRAIVLRRNALRVDRFWKVIVQDLLPVA